MSATTKLTSVLAILAAASSAIAGAAGATAPPATISGSWSVTPQIPTDFKQAGGNIKLTGISFSTWSGDLTGTTVADATFVIHPDGRVVGAPAREIFTGTLSGSAAGTLDLVEEAHAQPDGAVEIAATIVGGSGDIADVHGRIIFTGTCDLNGACAGTYDGSLQS
jgi:hypothetical protein